MFVRCAVTHRRRNGLSVPRINLLQHSTPELTTVYTTCLLRLRLMRLQTAATELLKMENSATVATHLPRSDVITHHQPYSVTTHPIGRFATIHVSDGYTDRPTHGIGDKSVRRKLICSITLIVSVALTTTLLSMVLSYCNDGR